MHDIIGDIHGHADELKSLLIDLGYSRHGRGFRHAERKIAFVGDFVDRGPAIAQVVEIARATVEFGDGLAVVAKGGKLVAYRWDGESVLSSDKFHWVGKK